MGPSKILRYKDNDKYACILENNGGACFHCSMAHVVPIDSVAIRRGSEM